MISRSPARLACWTGLTLLTARELVRRPGARLVAAFAAALLLVLPAISARALDDSGFLARELTASTILLTLTVAAAVLGAAVVDEHVGFGVSTTLRAAPRALADLLVARLAGALLALLALQAWLLVVATVALAVSRGLDAAFGPGALFALAGTATLTGLLALCIGAVVGAFTGARAGAVLAAAIVLGLRALPPHAIGLPDGVALLVPDVSRLDLARPLGRGALPPLPSVWLALAAAAVQSIGMIAVTTWALRRREAA